MCNLKDDLKLSLSLFADTNEKRLERAINELNQVLVVLGSVLDKPLKDDPKYACGDAIEAAIIALANIKADTSYYGRMIMAKALAWDRYPGHIIHDEGAEIDVDDWCRAAFIHGYMESSE